MTSSFSINTALSDLLLALGFVQMARDVKTETATDRLAKYARVIVKNAPAAKRDNLIKLFRSAGLWTA